MNHQAEEQDMDANTEKQNADRLAAACANAGNAAAAIKRAELRTRLSGGSRSIVVMHSID